MTEEAVRLAKDFAKPDARAFYLRLGATIYTEVDSLISKGNKTPKLIYRL